MSDQKVICINHPKYDGSGSPVLSCRTCCALFISRIKKSNEGPAPETGRRPLYTERKRR